MWLWSKPGKAGNRDSCGNWWTLDVMFPEEERVERETVTNTHHQVSVGDTGLSVVPSTVRKEYLHQRRWQACLAWWILEVGGWTTVSRVGFACNETGVGGSTMQRWLFASTHLGEDPTHWRSVMKPSVTVCANDRAGEFWNEDAPLSVMWQQVGGGPPHPSVILGGLFFSKPQLSAEGRIVKGICAISLW